MNVKWKKKSSYVALDISNKDQKEGIGFIAIIKKA